MKKIILTGGGTGGHVVPALALVESLKKENYDIHYIGSKKGIEVELVKGLPYYPISTGKLRRYLDLENVTDLLRTVKGVGEAVGLMRKIKPHVVFSKGGFVSVPVVIAAKLCRVPVVVHESDMTCGLANKIAIPLAKVVCTGFEGAEVPSQKAVYTGTPIREDLFKGDLHKGAQLMRFTQQKPVLTIMGGSGGSAILNQVVREALPKLTPHFNLIHLCGKDNVEKALDSGGYKQLAFASEALPHLLAMTELMITRGGANALAEILALKKPSLIIPLSKKASRGDQIDNANNFKKHGYSLVLEEDQLTADILFDQVMVLQRNKSKLMSAMAEAKASDGVQKIVAIIKANTKD